MAIGNLSIIGSCEHMQKSKALLDFYSESRKITSLKLSTALIFENKSDELSGFGAAAAALDEALQELEELCAKKDVNLITYSFGDIRADLVAFNRQEREANVSYELMAKSTLVRIFIAHNKDYGVEDVLPAAAALYAGGEELADIAAAFNSLLK